MMKRKAECEDGKMHATNVTMRSPREGNEEQ